MCFFMGDDITASDDLHLVASGWWWRGARRGREGEWGDGRGGEEEWRDTA